jgi:hypothetical protein
VQGEDVSHIFFNYPLAKFVWSGIKERLEVSWNPSNFADVVAIFQRFRGRPSSCFGLFLLPNVGLCGLPEINSLLKLNSLNNQLTFSLKL